MPRKRKTSAKRPRKLSPSAEYLAKRDGWTRAVKRSKRLAKARTGKIPTAVLRARLEKLAGIVEERERKGI